MADSHRHKQDSNGQLKGNPDKRKQLERLLQSPAVRLAGPNSFKNGFNKTTPSGFPELDRLLQGGWPTAALTEIFVDRYGGGELRLLLPSLIDRLSSCPDALIACVAPPYVPYAPAFHGSGLEPSSLLLVNAVDDKEALWAMEQALQSSACVAVLGWVDKASGRCLRRLQLAAEQSGSWAVAFRPPQMRTRQSVAALRIRLKPLPATQGVTNTGGEGPGFLQLDVLKSRAGHPGRVCLQL